MATAQAYERLFAARVVAFHVPNGGKRDKATGARLKAMGVMAGVADWTVIRNGKTPGFIELKTEDGVQSERQRDFEVRVGLAGCPYRIARDVREFIAIMKEWAR